MVEWIAQKMDEECWHKLSCWVLRVSSSHSYRRFASVFDYSEILPIPGLAEKEAAYKGYGVLRLFKCLLLQFMEDLSDRELERYLEENTAGKWFAGLV